MEVNVSIGGGQKMTLTGAVLVYRGGNDAFAAWHAATVRKRKQLDRRRPVADVLIGAFALRFDGLLTRNAADFKTLFPTLKLIAP